MFAIQKIYALENTFALQYIKAFKKTNDLQKTLALQ